MSHDYHESHFEDTIIFDGCGECDERAKDPIKALLNLDAENYQALRGRMLAVEFGDESEGYRSANEARVGKHLYAIAVLEERYGGVR
jgi:hypothetical protein